MTRRLPDYVKDRLGWHLQRQAHARTAPPDCHCLMCLTTAEIHDRLMKQAGRDRPDWSEIPF